MKHPRVTGLPALASLLLSSGMALAGLPSTEVFLPAVGRIAGNGGAQFFTTVWATNLTSAPETFKFEFLKQGQANPTPASFVDTLQPGETKTYENIVETRLGLTSALGAGRITSSGEIFVAERIFNQEPGADLGDTEGLFFAGVPKDFPISPGQSASIQGINQGGGENFRYNLALVETGGAPRPSTSRSSTLPARFWDSGPSRCSPSSSFSPTSARSFRDFVGQRANHRHGDGRNGFRSDRRSPGRQRVAGFLRLRDGFRGSLLSDGNGTGVISLNGLTGSLNLTPGNGISITPSITPSGGSIQIAFTGGGSSGITSVAHDATLAGSGTVPPPSESRCRRGSNPLSARLSSPS